MRAEKILRVGRVTIDGDLIEFEPEATLDFQADRRDLVSIGVQYAYQEVTPDREKARIRITAHLDGQTPESYEAVIHDNPLLDDSRRGFVSVPVKLPARGALKGRFIVEATYAAGPWTSAAAEESVERVEGEFTVQVI